MSKRTKKTPARKTTKAAARKGGTTRKRSAEDAAPRAPRPPTAPRERDPRLPVVGATIERTYKAKTLRLKVLEDGFEGDGRNFETLSAAARHATGAKSINGFLFWGLIPRAGKPQVAAKDAAKPRTKKGIKAKGARADAAPAAPTAAAGAGEAK